MQMVVDCKGCLCMGWMQGCKEYVLFGYFGAIIWRRCRSFRRQLACTFSSARRDSGENGGFAGGAAAGAVVPELASVPRCAMADLSSLPKSSVFSIDSGGELVQRSRNVMKRTLNWWDLMWFSIGAVVGAGIFVITGIQARSVAGPAILLSYVAAGFSSMLSVFIYTEFALEVPTAGGSFAFLRVELGDFVAFLAAANVVMEYAVGTGAVARAWTSYLATLINKRPDELRIHTTLAPSFNMLDPIAVAVIWITGLIAAASTRGMSTINWIASTVNILLIAFIVIAGLSHSNPANYEPFMAFGIRGVFSASAIVYFAYLGFDAVATLAEETKRPARDIPIGLVGSMVMVTIIYCLMALTLCLMQKYTAIDPDAPFSAAFGSIGWNWARYLVALGALKGMTTVLLVGTVSQARYVTHIARTHMLPPWFAHIDVRTGTPVRATVMSLVLTSAVTLFTSLSVLSNLLSISTLMIFMLVAVALLVRRHYMPGETSTERKWLLVVLIFVIFGASVGIAAYWALSDGWVGHAVFGGIWFGATWCMWYFLPIVRTPKVWGVPWTPWLPAASISTNCFLMGSIDKDSFIRFGVFTAMIVVYYALVGLHASYDAAADLIEAGDLKTGVGLGTNSPTKTDSAHMHYLMGRCSLPRSR